MIFFLSMPICLNKKTLNVPQMVILMSNILPTNSSNTGFCFVFSLRYSVLINSAWRRIQNTIFPSFFSVVCRRERCDNYKPPCCCEISYRHLAGVKRCTWTNWNDNAYLNINMNIVNFYGWNCAFWLFVDFVGHAF